MRDWMWLVVGFVVGIICCYFVCDLVFPVMEDRREDNDEQSGYGVNKQ